MTQVAIGDDGDVVRVRQAARTAAVEAKLSLVDQTKLVTAASELARNTLVYGGGGTAELEVVANGARNGVRAVFRDDGPGIEDVERALELGACRNVNLKPGRVGGVRQSLEVRRICAAAGVPLWCGGMLESGVGRALNLALCSLEGFTDPADMSPASELYDYDLVDPTYDVGPDGTIAVPEAPGLGFDVTGARVAAGTLRRVEVPVPAARG